MSGKNEKILTYRGYDFYNNGNGLDIINKEMSYIATSRTFKDAKEYIDKEVDSIDAMKKYSIIGQ